MDVVKQGWGDQKGVAERLIDLGANVNAVCRGESALQMAVQRYAQPLDKDPETSLR